MNRSEAERLLGGHATGTLSEAERGELYRAALDHQELFDALMDEEALRELLVDPEARRKLLEALAPETEPAAAPLQPARRFRPAPWLGLAAGLLLAAVSLRHWRTEAPARLEALQHRAAEAKQEAAPAAPAPTPSPTPSPAPSPAPAVRAPKPRPAQPAEAPPGPEAAKPAAPERRAEEPGTAYSASKTTGNAASPATVEVIASGGAAADKSEYRLDQVVALPQGRAEAEGKRKKEEARAPRLAKAAPAAPAAAGAVADATWDPLAPTLTRLPDGRVRLRVGWPAGQALHALKRRGKAVEVLALARRPDGTAELEFPFATPEILDLYLLPAPAADPASLPESGRQRRLLPPPEKP